MEIEAIKDILKLINRSNLDEVEIEQKGFKIRVRKNQPQEVVYSTLPVQPAAVPAAPVAAAAPPAAAPAPAAEPAKAPAEKPKADDNNANLITVKSPMIGTFYRSPDPESDAFVQVGDTVSKGQVLCIIEAMKLFNEIESEVEGKIVKILVDNATPVEYDTPLFLVEP